jgi:hypothetical protein
MVWFSYVKFWPQSVGIKLYNNVPVTIENLNYYRKALFLHQMLISFLTAILLMNLPQLRKLFCCVKTHIKFFMDLYICWIVYYGMSAASGVCEMFLELEF